jgi:fucose permease
MVIGYIGGIVFIPKYITQAKALVIVSLLGVVGSVAVIAAPAAFSIWFIALMALGCSLMWPAIWPLAMTDLGRFTKAGSSLMVIAIVGGAVIPVIYGFLKGSVGAQMAYIITVPGFIYILYYALKGHKIRN